MKEQMIQVPDGKRAEWVDGVLTLVDARPEKTVNPLLDKSRPITERVQSFEDAMAVLGEEHPLVQQYRYWMNGAPVYDGSEIDLLAYLKLRIIVAALNEDWTPQFTKDECRHFPWFVIFSKDEVANMSEEERSRARIRSFNGTNAVGGVAFAFAGYDSSHSHAYYGSLLATKTSELAEYAGEQFIEIWADFMFQCSERPEKKSCSEKE